MSFVSVIDNALSILSIVAQLVIILLIFLIIFKKQNKISKLFFSRSLLFAFVVALAATLSSLFYSEIADYEPCKLCWFQRIFMYPQVILLGIALIKKEQFIKKYVITLSAIGGIIAFYHYLMQRDIVNATSCGAVGYSVNCAQIFVLKFGYITIPLMALTAFVLIFLLLLGSKK